MNALTTDTDSVSGTANNDVMKGTLNEGTPASGTAQIGDTIDGGAGTDTFELRIADATGAITVADLPTLTNVETLKITPLVAVTANDISLQGWTPNVTSVVVDAPLASMDIINVASSVGTYTLSNVATDAVDLTVTTLAGLDSGSNDALSLTLSGASAAATGTGTNFADVKFTGAAAGDGFDKVTVNSTGSANRLNSLTVEDGTGPNVSTMDSLTITGDQNLRINNALDFSGSTGTITASAATGNVNLTVGTEDITATFGGGDDRLAMSTAGDLTSADTIDMGAGTADTFAWAETATTTALNTALGRVSNFEKLEFTGVTTAIDMDLVGGVNTVVQSGAAAAAFTVSDMQDDDAVEISGNPAGSVTFTAKLDDGSNVLNLTLDSSTITGNGGVGVAAANMDTVNLVVAGSAASGLGTATDTFTVAVNGTINVTGDQDLDLGTLGGTNASVNANAFKGNLTVIGEAGNNTLTGGTGDDDLTGGNGQDTIVLGSGGTDMVVLNGITAAANRDIVTGFTAGAGGDLVDLDGGGRAADSVAAAQYDTFDGAQSAVTLDTSGGTAALVHEFTFALSNNSADLSAATDGSELFKGIATQGTTLASLTVTATTDTGHIVAYQGGNAYLYQFTEGSGAGAGDTALEADDIALVGVFNDIAVGAFTVDNFL